MNGVRYLSSAQPLHQGKPKKDRRYDDLAPRGVGPTRYRIYRLRGGDLQLLAAVPSEERLGAEIVRLYSLGEFSGGDDSLGIMDTATEPGRWVASPWTLGRRTE